MRNKFELLEREENLVPGFAKVDIFRQGGNLTSEFNTVREGMYLFSPSMRLLRQRISVILQGESKNSRRLASKNWGMSLTMPVLRVR